jgi:hypothetical protein
MLKIRSDMFFLLLAQTERRLVILTERDMYDQCLKEIAGGRVPKSIEFMHAELPPNCRPALMAFSKRGILANLGAYRERSRSFSPGPRSWTEILK